MDINDIQELYFITEIANVPSIMREGILSHKEARRIPHSSIAEEGVQERRQNKKVPGTNKCLHDYANLYFDAHNPMLSARRHLNDSICVLRIRNDVLAAQGVIVTDQNASRDCWFKSVADGLPLMKKEEIFAEFWLDDDPIEKYRKKGIKCAEVLVSERVSPESIVGAYVANNIALATFRQVSSLPVEIKANIFF
ncbi:MAG: DUF4433 domain-containing protein [Pseudomonadota bacterium]